MFFPARPTNEQIRSLTEKQRDKHFSYAEVGASRGQVPPGYRILHDRKELGRGSEAFIRALESLRRWKMFEIPGVWLYPQDTPIESGNVVAVLVKHFGFWSVNFCRIVYVIDETGSTRRFGFAYGTLAEHAERGEERFTVEWDRSSDMVSYDILSFSRPGSWKISMASPAAHWLQMRFVKNSLLAMSRAVREGAGIKT